MGMKNRTSIKTSRFNSRSRNPKGQRENNITKLITQPCYPGQWVHKYSLPGTTQLCTTSGTSFAIVYAIGTPSSQVLNWTDFSTLYDEYSITGVTIHLTCVTPPTPGMAIWFFDNSASGSPSATDEGRNGVIRTTHSMNDHKVWTMTFRNVDYSLLAFRRTVVDYDVGYFKGFTNAASFGTSAANTLLYEFRAVYHITFRGRKV